MLAQRRELPTRFALLAFPAVALSTLAGCGSDAPPPPPDGAFVVTMIQPTIIDPNVHCDIAGHTTTVGDINDVQRKTVIADGEDFADVNCTVSGTGPFKVT